MIRSRGVLDTVPGRVTLRVHLPADVIEAGERLAECRGAELAIILGDLVACVLPDALAEAAREVLTPDAQRPGVGTPDRAQLLTALTVAGSLSPGARTSGSPGDATAP